jgi:autotransporter-associated beta strand protein
MEGGQGGNGGSGGPGIFNTGTIANLTNTGYILSGTGGNRGNGGNGMYPGSSGANGSATYGIHNNSVITTLNNQQGASSSALTYRGALPVNYNVIIVSTTDFGKLSVTSASGTMTFGISSLSTANSTILNTTLSSVLSGVASSNLLNTSGTSNGYTFALTQTTSTSGIWDLLITAYVAGNAGSSSGSSSGSTTISTVSSGTSVGLISLGASPVLSGGTLVLLSGDSSSTAFSVAGASTIQNPTSGSAKLSGVFSGAGSLTFTGSGTTVLSGSNTYSGGTTVSGGTLSLAGGSPTGTGDVYVASAGTLMGTGTIAGNLSVAGVLKPGNSPGYLAASNNVVMNTGSIYQQDIAGLVQASSATPVGATGYYSLLDVGGQFTINAGATLTPRLSNLFTPSEAGYGSAIYVPALGDRFRMVTATGGISGRFSTLTQPAELASGTQLIAFYNVNDSKSIDLAVTPTSYSTTLALSTNSAKSVAVVLDQLLGVNKVGAATAAQDSLLYAVAGQTAASLPGFAQGLSGEIHAASAATLPQATQRLQQAVLARLGDFPMPPTQFKGAAGSAFSSGAITGNNPLGLPTANMSSNPAVNPNSANVTSAAVADGRAWGEIAYQRGERASSSVGNGFNNNLYQAVFGVDAYTNAELGLKLGGGLALSNTTVTATGGNSTIQQGALFVYGKMTVAEDYVLDGMASLGLSSTKLSRSDITGLSSGFSNNSVMGNDALLSVGLSRAFETNDLRITPYARLTYQYVGQAAYDEGSSAAALSVARLNASGVRAVVGVGAGSLNKDPLKDEYTYRANLAIGADSQGLLNPTLNTTLGGFASSVTTPTAGSTFVQAGLYGTLKVADSAYAYAGVSAEARTGQTLYGGSVGLRVAF